jgi:HlyD family secretion protein
MMKNVRKCVYIGSLLITVCMIAAGCSQKAMSADKNNTGIVREGNVEAQEVTISSKVPGRIADVFIDEGAQVVPAQNILTLEKTELEAKKKQAEGALLAAQAVYNKAKNGARPQEIELAKANVEMAESKVKLLEDTYQRLYNLHEAGAYTTQDLQKTETELIAAKEQVRQANEQLSMAAEGTRKEDILAAEANIVKAKGALEEINASLSETVVKSPVKGTVSSVMHFKGELVGTGTPLFTIIDYNNIWVEVNLSDEDLSYVKIGDEASVEYNGTTSKGKVININRNPDFAVKKSTNEMSDKDVITYAVKVKILEPHNFFPGLRVKVNFNHR